MWRHNTLALAVALASTAATPATPPARVWVDAYGFAPGETLPLRDAVQAARHAVLTAYVTRPTFAAKGYWHPADWDLYWAPRAACERVWAVAPARARCSCVPGAAAVTSKPDAAAAIASSYGEEGHTNIAQSIHLPSRAWDAVAAVAAAGDGAPWALKTVAHRGVGVTVLDGGHGETAAAVARTRRGVLQPFVEPQARLAAPDAPPAAPPARFYIRAWALLASGAPSPRAYMYDGGFAIAGSAPRDGRIVNLWLAGRAASTAVRVRDLARFVVPVPSDRKTFLTRVNDDMRSAFGAALAAAAPTLAAAAGARAAGALGAQLVGADFAVTSDGRAVLLEINEAPSLARMGKGDREADPTPSTAAFDGEKEGVAAAVVAFAAKALEVSDTPHNVHCDLASLGVTDAAAVRAAAAEAAAARATGWTPLAPAVLAGLDQATSHAAATPLRTTWRRTLRDLATSRLGAWLARTLAAAAPRALTWVAARGAAAGVLGAPDPVPPPGDVVRAARWLAECA